MPILSWTEIRQRAINFSRDWIDETEERAEAQTFWNEFFNVFGMKRRQIATFEEKVKKVKGSYGRIDLFWKKNLLAEHKSKGEDLGKANSQAFEYIQDLINEGRSDECPRYVATSDFSRIILHDLEPDNQLELPQANCENSMEVIEIPVAELHKHIKHFAFIAGHKTYKLREQDPANLEAVKLMARLHDTLEAGGYEQPDLERLLVRLLFCLFADDTGIFDPDEFELLIDNHTREDGYDLGPILQRLFSVLNTPDDKRPQSLPEEFSDFPYINGELFSAHLNFADFNFDMRNALLAACRFEWSKISPAIFGSLFQGVMEKAERRKLGAHYTSERDILRVIEPLFLDDLQSEFEQIAADKSTRQKGRLKTFQKKLGSLKFLDPACGCGNFLVIAYRELRRLELKVIKLLNNAREIQQLTAIELQTLSLVDVDQFYGIEIDIWPSRIAETALWLTDHQMNRELSEAFGQIFLRIPLKKSPHIHCKNALTIPWQEILPPEECNYILGNPPFVGKHLMDSNQKADFDYVWKKHKDSSSLDLVTCWYHKAAAYTKDTKQPCAFVSTNSLSQGEQVAILWNYLYSVGLHINFAHRTFKWISEASGAAHVYVVIIGFSHNKPERAKLYEYDDIKADGRAIEVDCISPYLTAGNETVAMPRNKPICQVPPTIYGNKPADNGNLIVEPEDYQYIKKAHAELLPLIRPMVCAHEYLHGKERFCFWLVNAPPKILQNNEYLKQRIQACRDFRKASKKLPTQEAAKTAYLFAEIRQPKGDYIVIPQHTSETSIKFQ